jgi:hypothetical protein
MRFPNQQLINQVKKPECDKYRILLRRSARLATPNKQEDDKSKSSDFKIIHYHNKFWKATLAGYLIKFTNIHFSEVPNKSMSKRARAARRGEKIHKETNQILVAISLGKREPPPQGDRDSIEHQTRGTNTINQYDKYLSEP